MKKLTLFTASILLGFGLVSCKSDKGGASTDDKKAPSADTAGAAADGSAATTETVSIKVTGMT